MLLQAMMMVLMVMPEIDMYMERGRTGSESGDAEGEHGNEEAAHEYECMSAWVGRQRSLRFLRCRTNAARVSRLT